MEKEYSANTLDRPTNSTKLNAKFLVAGVAILTGGFAWFLYRIFLDTLFVRDSLSIILISLVILLFLTSLSMIVVVLIFSSRKITYSTSATLSLTPILVFLDTNLFVAVGIGAVYMLVLISTMHTIEKAYSNQVHYFFPGIIRLGLSMLTFFTVLFISLFHYVVVVDHQNVANVLEDSLAKYSISGVNLFMSQFDAYDSSMTLDSFILLAGAEGLLSAGEESTSELNKTLGGLFDVDAITSDIILKQRDAVRSEFLSTLGIIGEGITGTTPIEEVWEAYTRSKTQRLLEQYQRFLPAIISMGLFLTLLFISKILKYIVYLFTWLIIGILRLMGVLTYKEKNITIKRLEYIK
jgi:hypothetical protein